jgi:hypothetical protein
VPTSPTNREIDQQVYLVVFDSFSASKPDVAEETGFTAAQVSRSLDRLRGLQLVDAYDVNGASQGSFRRGQYGHLQWQCYDTYDSITREQAVEKFNQAMGAAQEATTMTDQTPTETTEAPARVAQPKLTNSQRAALLHAQSKRGGVNLKDCTDLSRKPYDYFVECGYATKDGDTYKLTDTGKTRAKGVNKDKVQARAPQARKAPAAPAPTGTPEPTVAAA